jgi:ferredoxin
MHKGLQLFGIVHIGLHYGHAGHHLYLACWQAACGDCHLMVLQAEAGTHMAADKATTAED